MPIFNMDVLSFLKEQKDSRYDLFFFDPPYNASSEWSIGKDGEPKMKFEKDFNRRWKGLDDAYLDEFFRTSFKKMKHGAFMVFYGFNRQLLPFQYYAMKHGFDTQYEPLCWYKTINFPKATSCQVMIKKAGYEGHEDFKDHKYGIVCLRQLLEFVFIIQKPKKENSYAKNYALWKDGDETVSPMAFNIENAKFENGTFPSNSILTDMPMFDLNDERCLSPKNIFAMDYYYCEETPPLERMKEINEYVNSHNSRQIIDGQIPNTNASQYSHQMNFSDIDYELYMFHRLANEKEKEMGLEDMEKKKAQFWIHKDEYSQKNFARFMKQKETANTHPTIKPISLNRHIGKLLRMPYQLQTFNPFCGTLSEAIGLYYAGHDIDKIDSVEINPEYYEIAQKRLQYARGKVEGIA